MLLDVRKLFPVELCLERSTPGDRDYFLSGVTGIVDHQPPRDVHHHVAYADDSDSLSDREVPRGERRQQVVVVNEILGGVDALGVLTRQTHLFRALRSHGKHYCSGVKTL